MNGEMDTKYSQLFDEIGWGIWKVGLYSAVHN